MAGYLFDTNTVSLLAPKAGKPSTAHGLQDFVRLHGDSIYLSCITLAELQVGVSRLERQGATSRANALARWLEGVLAFYDKKTLPMTCEIALQTGRLLDGSIGRGTNPGFEDAAIAATAAFHDLTVVTANARHFAPLGVPFIAPPA